MSDRVARMSTGAERRQAAQLRLAKAGGRSGERSAARRELPTGIGRRRSQPFASEVRAKKVDFNDQQRFHVEGHASVVDRAYDMWDAFGAYEEVIDRHAFTDTLSADPDVAFLVNHRGLTMARTVAPEGREPTLQLGMDDVGLGVQAWLNPKRQDVQDLVAAIEDQDITEMSFAFMLEEGWWSEDFTTFKITKLDLHRGDVSAVNYGANPYTDVAARAAEVLADLDHLPAAAARAAVVRLQARSDVGTSVADRSAELQAVERKVDPTAPEVTTRATRSLAHIEALLEV